MPAFSLRSLPLLAPIVLSSAPTKPGFLSKPSFQNKPRSSSLDIYVLDEPSKKRALAQGWE